ncbi:hypothetical protein [Pyxidicoccus trucidator]|uniref:hypothetical protein n=1 Tax=Pyxidicoccus trucidator TaxID=2709662 RepID=UPI0013DCA091|nr:hypothetical protein [Pyxidicoccus trucidator]
MSASRFTLFCGAALLVTSFGCATTQTPGDVRLRSDGTPGPEKCPEEARKAMNYLRMFVGEAAFAELDVNQSSARGDITLYEGPIESMLEDNLGLLEAPSRLYGRVWTSGPRVVIRYYEAQPVRGGDKVPICAVARMGLGQLQKRPESKPGTAVIGAPSAGVFIVDEFR